MSSSTATSTADGGNNKEGRGTTEGGGGESAAAAAASTSSVASLWQSLDRELRLNIGTSVRCGICLTTVTNPVRTPCVHAFCSDCIQASLLSGNPKCPECNTAITRRGLQPFEYLEDLSNAYKATLREFGFIPTKYNPSFVTMTQKVATSQGDCDDDDEQASPEQILDRLDVATVWQQQALPNIPNLPPIQKSENELVVQSNWDACKGLLVSNFNSTQDMQEQTREQEQADEEWNDHLREEEEEDNNDEEDKSDEDFFTASEGGEQNSQSSKRVSFGLERPLAVETESKTLTTATSSTSTILEDVTPKHTNKTFLGDETFVASSPTTTTTKDDDCPSSPPFEDTELSPIQVQASQQPVAEEEEKEEEEEEQQLAVDDNDNKRADITAGMMEDSFGALHLMPNESNLIKENNNNDNDKTIIEQHQHQHQQEDGKAEDEEEEVDSDKTQTPLSASCSSRSSSSASSSTTSSSSSSSSSSKKYKLNPTNDIVRKWNSFGRNEDEGIGTSPRYRTKLGKILSNRKISTTPSSCENHQEGEEEEEERDQDIAAKRLFDEEEKDSMAAEDSKPAAKNDTVMDELDGILGDNDDTDEEKEDSKPAATRRLDSKEQLTKKPETEEMSVDEDDHDDEDTYGFSTTPTKNAAATDEASWSVGDIVNVQSRTWPGVNKPGGVARITKVHDGGKYYNVAYILGGKEANIDSGFISHNEDLSPSKETQDMILESQQQKAQRQRRRRRCEQNELPMALLQSLEKDGFDTTGNVPMKTPVVKKQKTTGALQDTTNDQIKNTKARKGPAKTTATDKKTAVITPTDTSNKKTKKRVSFGYAAPVLSQDQAILRADASYAKLMETAIKQEKIHIVTSNLSNDDLNMLKTLASKKLQNVKLRVSNTFGKNSTICILPVVEGKESSLVRPKVRTVKAMRSALAGVPMVSPEWIKLLASEEKLVFPPASMIVRALPTKTSSESSNGGVAQLAAAPTKGLTLLQDLAIFLCGSFPSNQRSDMHVLASTAGAKVLKQPSEVLTRLRQQKPLVVLCFNGNISPVSIEKELTASLTENHEACLVVNPNWLFDSIACTKAMPPNNFAPPDYSKSRKAHELWRLCCYKNPFK